jgi:hypothetical protein
MIKKKKKVKPTKRKNKKGFIFVFGPLLLIGQSGQAGRK